jgi:septal ring factor EnvC (AmiA/AmiB activator)
VLLKESVSWLQGELQKIEQKRAADARQAAEAEAAEASKQHSSKDRKQQLQPEQVSLLNPITTSCSDPRCITR